MKKHSDGFAVIPCYARHKVLRRLHTAGWRFHGHPGNRDRHTGTPRIRIERLIADQDSLRWIRGKNPYIRYIGRNRHRLILRCNLGELQRLVPLTLGYQDNGPGKDREARCLGGQLVFSNIHVF